MGTLINRLKSALLPSPVLEPGDPDIPDLQPIISQIIERNRSGDIEPGRRIHEFCHRNFTLRLDYDVTKTYRLTIYRGTERIYSFSIYCKACAADDLKIAYNRVITFLNGDRKLKELPDNDLLKGFYFGG